MRTRLHLLLVTMMALLPGLGRADVADTAFDAANKLYEQGRFTDAAEAYEKVVPTSFASPALYFNEGNAWYKSGKIGQAIVAYRQAAELTPGDADLQANLQFVRNQVQGPTVRQGRWQDWINLLTLNAWTWATAAALWVTFILLAIIQIVPRLKTTLRSWTLSLGCLCLVLCACLGYALFQHSSQTAVVVQPEVTVRTGPFNESQNAFVVHDGAELRVLDKRDNWLQVTDGGRQIGWINQDSAILLKNS